MPFDPLPGGPLLPLLPFRPSVGRWLTAAAAAALLAAACLGAAFQPAPASLHAVRWAVPRVLVPRAAPLRRLLPTVTLPRGRRTLAPLAAAAAAAADDDALAIITSDAALEAIALLPPGPQLAAVGERLVLLIGRVAPGFSEVATAVTAKLLDRGVPECLRLLRHPAELERVVRELEAEVRPPVVLRPDPEAAARHRVAEAATARAAYVANNWWKEIREQHKGYGDPTPEVLQRLRIRSQTAVDLGKLGPWLMYEARREKEGTQPQPRDWKIYFSVSTGRGSAVMVAREAEGAYEIMHLVANTMLPGEGDAQLALVQHLARLAKEKGHGATIRLSPTVVPTLFGSLQDFGFNDDLEFQGP